jgi:hypothetical protein
MGQGLFWGLFLILIGFALIIKYVFNLEIPVLRVAIAVFLILIGIRLLLKNRWEWNISSSDHDVIFTERTFRGSEIEKSEYNIIFGHAIFDLTDLDSTDLPKKIKINTVFGGTQVKINEDIPLLVSGDAVFAGARLSDENSTVFGELSFKSKTYEKQSDCLHLESDVIFGAFELKRER